MTLPGVWPRPARPKSALGGAEVGQAESDIGPHDANQSDSVDVVAFRDHLRADNHVEFAFVEGV
jgi:hypothetical protein